MGRCDPQRHGIAAVPQLVEIRSYVSGLEGVIIEGAWGYACIVKDTGQLPGWVKAGLVYWGEPVGRLPHAYLACTLTEASSAGHC